MFELDEVDRYYSKATANWNEVFGRDHVVHIHGGYEPDPDATRSWGTDRLAILEYIRNTQQRMLDECLSIWGLEPGPTTSVLDVGCGLGGTLIHLARTYGASGTGITVATDHVPLATEHAERAGVGELVDILYADACAPLPGEHQDRRFDAALAMESSMTFWARDRWFDLLATQLGDGGIVCVMDNFTDDDEVKDRFDRRCRANVCGLAQYEAEAARGGFTKVVDVDITEHCLPVGPAWMELHRLQLEQPGLTPKKRTSLELGLRFAEDCAAYIEEGRFEYHVLTFERARGR
jgi:tocopherol O-methyltransferase